MPQVMEQAGPYGVIAAGMATTLYAASLPWAVLLAAALVYTARAGRRLPIQTPELVCSRLDRQDQPTLE